MEKNIFDNKNGLWYELQGDYYLPCLNCRRKNSGLSAYGDSGTYRISNSIKRCCIPIYSPATS